MSQLKGGRADKFGNAFERLWIVYLALDVVEGHASSIQWEPLGPEGAGVECVLARPDGTREKHQCKIENGTTAKWSAADLADVLTAARTHLVADPAAVFVFVSRDPARGPSDLADRARSCDDRGKDFLAHCLTSEAHRRDYRSLCRHWELSSTEEADAQVAIGLLQRMHFERGFWEPSEKQMLYRLAESVVEGRGKEIVSFLGAHLEETLGNTQRSDDLRAALRSQGLPPLELASDRGVPDGIERLQARFRSALEPYLIGAELLSRPEPERLVERMVAGGGSRLLFVTGDAGSGKSGVLLDAVRLLDAQKVPYLPIRLDTHYPDTAVRTYSKERLELPASPGVCLHTLADDRRAVLIIDQLDAIRWTSANSDLGWELCKEILDEALRFPNISVVVAGRTVDLDDDPRIKHWKEKVAGQQIEVEPFRVGRLPDDVVASVVERYNVAYAALPTRETALLSNAQSLYLWWRLAKDGKAGTFSSRAALLDSYWRHYRDKAVREFPPLTPNGLRELLDQLVGFMDTRGRLDAPNALLQANQEAAAALRGLGILHRTNGTTRFAHQSHLDYLTIERVFLRSLQAEETPFEWLRRHDQSLFRRDQVRLLLQLLRDQDSRLYLEFLQDIFFGDGVRFHIQHLALTSLAQADPPTDDEHVLITRLWKEESWHVHVLELVLAGHEPWLTRFTDDGTIPAMLASGDEAAREEALRLCSGSAVAAPAWFERVLAPHWDSGCSEWAALIEARLSYRAEHDTSVVFQWRLARTRRGVRELEIYDADALAKKDQARAIAYLAAIAEGLLAKVESSAAGDGLRHVDVPLERFKNLLDACEAHPRLGWNGLLPVYKRAAQLETAIQAGDFSAPGYIRHDGIRLIISLLSGFLRASGRYLLQSEGVSFLVEMTVLGQAPAPAHVRRLIVELLSTTPNELTDDAVTCFLSVESPLDIKATPEPMARTDRLSPHDPAITALRVLAAACSGVSLQQLERAVLAFHADHERQSVEWQLELIREGSWPGNPNCYGLAQYALLLALPEHRLSIKAHRSLRMWRSKFGDLRKYRDTEPMKALPIVSPIPSGKAKFLSDEQWLRIVKDKFAGRRGEWRKTKEEVFVEASPRNFASSLEEAGQLDPGRYVRLGLRFPKDAEKSYFLALLRAAALGAAPKGADSSWTAAPVRDIEALIAQMGDRENAEVAKGISHVVRQRSGEVWAEVTLNLLREYALHHPDPDGSSWTDASGGQDDIRGLETIVLNSARCSAIGAASELLWAHPGLLGWAKELAEGVIQDPHPAVRAASLELAYAIGAHDLDLALSLLVRAYTGTEDAVIRIPHGRELLRYLWRREAELTPVFERAMASSDEKTVELAAYWTTVGETWAKLYTDLARQADAGSPAARVGVVRALVDIAHQREEHRAACLERLAVFADDEDEKVLHAVARIFRRDGFLDTPEAPAFAHRFACSAAFQKDAYAFLHPLSEFESSLLPYAEAIEASVAELTVPRAGETQSVARRLGLVGEDVATILLRLYQQAEGADDAALRHRCLDQWDALLRARIGTGQDVLAKIDS